jgi:FkbH-like protein
VKDLSKRGVVLAACSKNNAADARGPFEQNPGMVLSLDDFAHFEASWDSKVVGIQRIAKTLQLGLDSFVFFDDNPAEREHIRQALPDVEVVEVPEDPAEFVRALEAGHWFEAMRLTGEDQQRVDQYRHENQRRTLEASFHSMDEYLASLSMVGDIRAIEETDLDRVVQLIGKTNQFNLTTRRHSATHVRAMLAHPMTIGRSLRLTDRFGDYGLIAVILAVAAPDSGPSTLLIDTWLMSCRVINRTAEEFFFNALCTEARARGIEHLVGCFVPTAKNGLVQDLYKRLGFAPRGLSNNGSVLYDLELTKTSPAKTFVETLSPRAP